MGRERAIDKLLPTKPSEVGYTKEGRVVAKGGGFTQSHLSHSLQFRPVPSVRIAQAIPSLASKRFLCGRPFNLPCPSRHVTLLVDIVDWPNAPNEGADAHDRGPERREGDSRKVPGDSQMGPPHIPKYFGLAKADGEANSKAELHVYITQHGLDTGAPMFELDKANFHYRALRVGPQSDDTNLLF